MLESTKKVLELGKSLLLGRGWKSVGGELSGIWANGDLRLVIGRENDRDGSYYPVESLYVDSNINKGTGYFVEKAGVVVFQDSLTVSMFDEKKNANKKYRDFYSVVCGKIPKQQMFIWGQVDFKREGYGFVESDVPTMLIRKEGKYYAVGQGTTGVLLKEMTAEGDYLDTVIEVSPGDIREGIANRTITYVTLAKMMIDDTKRDLTDFQFCPRSLMGYKIKDISGVVDALKEGLNPVPLFGVDRVLPIHMDALRHLNLYPAGINFNDNREIACASAGIPLHHKQKDVTQLMQSYASIGNPLELAWGGNVCEIWCKNNGLVNLSNVLRTVIERDKLTNEIREELIQFFEFPGLTLPNGFVWEQVYKQIIGTTFKVEWDSECAIKVYTTLGVFTRDYCSITLKYDNGELVWRAVNINERIIML